MGDGRSLDLLVSISTTFHIGGRRLGDACVQSSPTWNTFIASSSEHWS